MTKKWAWHYWVYLHRLFKSTLSFSPHWHELWKKEKSSSLVPPRGSMSSTGCQINLINVIFYLQKSLEIFDKNSADKIWPKKDKEIKVSPFLPIRVKVYVLFCQNRLKHMTFRIVFIVVLGIFTFGGGQNLYRKLGQQSAICWNSLGLFRDYGLNQFFLGIKLFCF